MCQENRPRDTRKGAHGGGYFFINIGVHPIGLPALLTNKLLICEQPKEYECILRWRIEEISQNEQLTAFRKSLVFTDNKEVINALIKIIPTEVDQWLEDWGAYEKCANAEYAEISRMLTVVPRLKEKAFLMLKFYCSLRMGYKRKSEQYLNTKIAGLEFPDVDNYLKSLLTL